MARTRTTKSVAQRIDLNYFKRSTPFKSARLVLIILAPLVALGWIAWRGFARDSRVYSSGRMSNAHAVLEKRCEVCHVRKAGEFSASAADSACLACHDGPVHHQEQVKADVPACATCHIEHRGRVNIVASSNASCATCHSNLKVAAGALPSYAHIYSLEDGHPEVTVHRTVTRGPGTILLNHFVHMKPIRQGPNGPIVQMECWDCHRPDGYKASWPYADSSYVDAKVSYEDKDVLLPLNAGSLQPRRVMPRAYMAPVRFATACAGCHLLVFDKRFDTGVPHDKPQVVHDFLVKKFQEYIAAHPVEVRVVREPQRDLTGKPIPPEAASDEELKLYALEGLMNSDPDRAIPILERVLKTGGNPKLKERALFVLAQSGSPKSLDILAAIAKGQGNPDLQQKAVEYLGVFGGAENRKLLGEIYKSTNDTELKQRILNSFMVSGDRASLFDIAKSDPNPDMRRQAVHQLGVSGGVNELWQLYSTESNTEVKKSILEGLFLTGHPDKLFDLANHEKDPQLRMQAIRQLGLMGSEKTGTFLISLYAKETDPGAKRAAIEALWLEGNAKALVDIARKETDPARKKEIVQKLALMNNKEGNDYLLELLNK